MTYQTLGFNLLAIRCLRFLSSLSLGLSQISASITWFHRSAILNHGNSFRFRDESARNQQILVISRFVVHFLDEKNEPKLQPHQDPQAFLKSLSAESHKVGKLLENHHNPMSHVEPITWKHFIEFRVLFNYGVYYILESKFEIHIHTAIEIHIDLLGSLKFQDETYEFRIGFVCFLQGPGGDEQGETCSGQSPFI